MQNNALEISGLGAWVCCDFYNWNILEEKERVWIFEVEKCNRLFQIQAEDYLVRWKALSITNISWSTIRESVKANIQQEENILWETIVFQRLGGHFMAGKGKIKQTK